MSADLRVILAVFRRNFGSYFAGVLGYAFIVGFVFVGALLAFRPQFFTDNLANLDQLSLFYPWVLILFIPAITMSAWADERKLGTDELLFTLPASDLSILLGKYLATVAVFTLALLFTFPYLIVLARLGNPDWGIIFTTYVGYWLAGAALLSVGLFASSLTDSTPVAYVLGGIFCAALVFIGSLSFAADFLKLVSIPENLQDFTLGIIPLSGTLYFLSIIVLMLYANYIVITQRHWSAEQGLNMGLQYVVRSLCLVVAVISLNGLVNFLSARPDFTAEKLFTLTDTTREAIQNIDPEHPVTIQAFVSPDVPREYVSVRKQFLGLLRQYADLGGSRVNVRVVDVEPFSEESEEARHLGLTPRNVPSEEDGRMSQVDIYMGATVISNLDQVVLPFIDLATPIEYELTSSISTVSTEKRKTVGILRTDAGLMGESRNWRIVDKIGQSYNLVSVAPDSLPEKNKAGDKEKIDVLIAALPSSLTEPEMQNLVDYVKAGNPVLIFDDPLPVTFASAGGVMNAPRVPKPAPQNQQQQMMMGMPQGPEKADGGKATALLRALEIGWQYDRLVTQKFNPHPQFEDIPGEFIFVHRDNGGKYAFNEDSPITSDLQEVLLMFPGEIRQPNYDSKYTLTPLLRTGMGAGTLEWEDYVSPQLAMLPPQFVQMQLSMGGIPLRPDRPARSDEAAYLLAAQITHKSNPTINAIYVADLDLISDFLVSERDENRYGLSLDNVTFVLNCIDSLAGDQSQLELRKRREQKRTLTEFEQITRKISQRGTEKEAQAEAELKQRLEDLRDDFQKRQELIEKDSTLDATSRERKLQQEAAAKARALDVMEKNNNRESAERKREIKAETTREKRRAEREQRAWAILVAPLPAVLLGIVMAIVNLVQQRRQVTTRRRV